MFKPKQNNRSNKIYFKPKQNYRSNKICLNQNRTTDQIKYV